MRAKTESSVEGYYLDIKDEHVDLLLHAVAKSLSEIYRGGYEYQNLPDGWVGFRVCLGNHQVERIAGPGRQGDKSIKKLVVDFEKQQFIFER